MATLVKVAAATAAVGSGAYYARVFYDIYSAEQDRNQSVTRYDSAKVELLEWESAIVATEQKELELQQAQQLSTKRMAEVDGRLSEARGLVSRLEAEKSQVAGGAAEAAAAMQEARSYRQRLQQRVAGAGETIAMLERSMSSSRQQTEAARAQLNPLNHPLVKQYVKQWQN